MASRLLVRDLTLIKIYLNTLKHLTGFWVTESRAICKYLAATYAGQGTRLLPDLNDVHAAAFYDQWASVELTYFDCYVTVLVSQLVFYR